MVILRQEDRPAEFVLRDRVVTQPVQLELCQIDLVGERLRHFGDVHEEAAVLSVTTFCTFPREFSPFGFDSWAAVVIIE